MQISTANERGARIIAYRAAHGGRDAPEASDSSEGNSEESSDEESSESGRSEESEDARSDGEESISSEEDELATARAVPPPRVAHRRCSLM